MLAPNEFHHIIVWRRTLITNNKILLKTSGNQAFSKLKKKTNFYFHFDIQLRLSNAIQRLPLDAVKRYMFQEMGNPCNF
jgi:hypothetical protein